MNDHITDRDLKAAFAARAAGAPNPDLAARISAETAQTRQSRRFLVLPGFASQATTRLAWAAVLAALTVALVGVMALGVGGRPITGLVPSESPTPSVEPSPSADPSVDPSVQPSVEPSPVPTEPAGPSGSPSAGPSGSPSEAPSGSPFIPADLGPNRIGRVVATDGLRVRSLPTLGEASQRLEPTLEAGVKFYVVDGPVMADGYAWYQIDPYGGDPALTPFGWVAAGSREGEPWIENLFDGCDSIGVSIELLAEMPAQEALYCYGEVMPGDIELTGNLYCDFGDIEGLGTGPEWLESDRYCELRAPDWNIHDGVSLRVWGQAATSLLEQGSPVDGQYTVTGHFDDPGASECRPTAGTEPETPAALAVLECRMHFVVTEVTPANG